jgi:hypothetical protein
MGTRARLAKGPDGALVSKFAAPHFEFPASGEEPQPRRSPCASRHGGPAPPGETLTLTTWRARNYSGHAPATDALGVKQEFEKALAQDGKPAK